MKINELNKENASGLFVGLIMDTKSKSNIAEFIKDNDIPNRTPNSKLHFTLIYSTTPVKDFEDRGTINPMGIQSCGVRIMGLTSEQV